jgi:hypothetical protein
MGARGLNAFDDRATALWLLRSSCPVIKGVEGQQG